MKCVLIPCEEENLENLNYVVQALVMPISGASVSSYVSECFQKETRMQNRMLLIAH